MSLPDFQFASGLALAYPVIKFGLLVLMAFSSELWRKSGWLLVALLVGGAGLTAIGTLFKIEHWAFGSELLLAGAALMASAYAWWYRAKRPRRLLDHLKLAWVLAACASVVAMATSHALVRPVAGIAEALFWGMALLYGYQRWIRRPEPASPQA
ncbi:hypothetical protein [Hymenobacter ruricola]|uniref:Uncharacterized protein n=1 Tax=Hymenobacter ruricola TaxID=2791023 RepID=A0ABS0I1P9_9BACT|nr:hypothetical protein [Hymenobacter ruricola]MBF9220850.1 hypothetical protein [Hymenobacter ruricola]